MVSKSIRRAVASAQIFSGRGDSWIAYGGMTPKKPARPSPVTPSAAREASKATGPLRALPAEELEPEDSTELPDEPEDEGPQYDVVTTVGPYVRQGHELVAMGIIPAELLDKYTFFSYKHAAEILHMACRPEFDELIDMLTRFEIETEEIRRPGGNESEIPRKVSDILDPLGWEELRVQGDLTVRTMTAAQVKRWEKGQRENVGHAESVLTNYVDGHLVDYVKGRVAFDLEWNSKDQTYDRDLVAMGAFYVTNVISAGVLLTRDTSLTPIFPKLGTYRPPEGVKGKPVKVKSKFGASTTWMGKLLYRLETNRNGGCPVLAIGIKPRVISDLDAWLAAHPEEDLTPKPREKRPAAPKPIKRAAPSKGKKGEQQAGQRVVGAVESDND